MICESLITDESLVINIRSLNCKGNLRSESEDKSASLDSMSTMISDFGETTMGREKRACAEIGRSTSASISGQRTGPPALNA